MLKFEKIRRHKVKTVLVFLDGYFRVVIKCFNLSANFYIFKPFSFLKPWNQILGATDAFSLIATFTSSFYFISSWSLQPFIFDWGVGCMYVRTYLCCLYSVSRGNVPYFGRMFLTLKYTDITQNTYIRSWTVTEIMAREVWKYDSCYTLIDYQIHIKTSRNM